ncbi:MAG: MBL fold metallo-hydrolase [Candidatus Fimimonas sp.]
MYQVFAQGILKTNSVVLVQNNKCVVVDIPYGAPKVSKFVQSNNLQVVAVLLTHGHFDHCGGVRRFLEKCQSNAPVFVHKNDVPLCESAASNRWHLPADDCFPTNTLVEGKLQIDDFCFEVLETPAHTDGSVCFVWENLILSGDTLFKQSVGRTDFPESVPHKMTQSLQKLCALQGDFAVIGGHGETTTLNYEKEHNPYLYDLIH